MEVRKPIWTSSSLLLYTGGLAVLVAALGSLAYLSSSYGKGALVAWSLLPLFVLLVVARGLRATGDFDDALIIALTGYGMASDRQRSAAAGIDHHLLKPASLEDLEQLLCAGPTAS